MNIQMTTNYDTIIVGGGAAGLMAGIISAKRGKHTLILEKMERPARKIMITGKGRCNVTNCCNIEDFMLNVPTNKRFLYSSLNAFSPYDTMAFFEDAGVALKVERGDRVFPISDDSADIADTLINLATASGCKITRGEVVELLFKDDKVLGVKTSNGESIAATNVIIATGGKSYPTTGSTGDGYKLAMQAGHTITDLRPSLIPIVCEGKHCRDMMGLSLKNVTLNIFEKSTNKCIFSELGEMLFTHFGISGPLVLSASCHMSDKISNYQLFIDMKPALTEQQLDLRILRDFEQFLNKDFINSLGLLLPKKMIPIVAQISQIPFDTKINQITKPQRQSLIKAIKSFPLNPTGFRPIEEAVITSGGVNVSEIDPKTMSSKKKNGLYFVGEILDVDAYTGGFNLQIAFSTGFCAGTHCK